MKANKKLALLGVIVVLTCVGCAGFSTTQKDYSYECDAKTGKVYLARKIYTKAAARTFYEAKSALTSWQASQTDKTQGAKVGGLNQEATATNLPPLVEGLSEGITKGVLKAMGKTQ